MRQEHRFVADLYRYISPFIDTAKPIYLSLDGEAAKKGVSEKHFDDAGVPDMWFTLIGATGSTLVEAKIVEGGKITIGQSQLSAWRSAGHGRHKPSAWVAANDSLDKFYYWRHDDYLRLLDACTSQKKYPKIAMPTSTKEFNDIRLLALELLGDK
jgi:hypothetical protein